MAKKDSLLSSNANQICPNLIQTSTNFSKIIVQGQIYYQINTALYPAPNETPSYGQLFIVDNNEATECRLHQNSNLDEELLRLIDNVMRRNNIFAQSNRMIHEEIQNQQQNRNGNETIHELQLRFLSKNGINRGRYNVQRANEVAAVFSTTADGEIPETYVTIYNKNTKTLQQVSTMDPNVEPWIYPLYYPYGNQVDKFISAEIPDPNKNENLHNIVMKHMIHGPCGDWCIVNDKCSKHFPKPFHSETTMDEDGYPHYRRRNNGLLYERPGGYLVDNQYVVPYCPMLLLLFNSHINVEIVSSHDAASVVIGENLDNKQIVHDEIRDFIEARYVGPVEACWRILSKPLQEKSHAIVRLPVHLPNEHSVVIDDNSIDNTMRSALERVTMLIDYFELNARATSFQELKTVNNEVHPTFTAACLALGLIEDDEEWYRAMNEAKVWMMPKRFRRLFVRILIHCQPVHPKKLWDDFKIEMSEDYMKRYGSKEGIKRAYSHISNLLHIEGWDISDFPEMEQIAEKFENDNQEEVNREALIGMQQYEQLNVKQKEIVDTILAVIDGENNSGTCFYIDGPGGSGKTFIYTTMYYLLKSRNKVVSAMAFTGIAATLLPNGKTVHKVFGLPVPLFDDSTSNIKIQSKDADNLKRVNVFILDEAPMAPRYVLNIMDRTLRDIMQNDLDFGGKIVLLGGDFRQLLPVKERKNIRVLPQEKEFAQFLLDLGNGSLNDQSDNIQIPERCIADINANIVRDMYGDIIA
ncbi:PREDICTED: uncharacterized protein LOC105556539, partial [Vollenhovia emeryi]|uniref:uncharacterized protein LOC105556539 n=1 Tax=Vollenhovia emeryi TaxID=411798 RepID=UPI0005F54457